MKLFSAVVIAALIFPMSPSFGNEVLKSENTQIIERVHPKTGRVFKSITAGDSESPFTSVLDNKESKEYARPDYRLLDNRYKKGEIFYDGPVSDRKKVYIFAGTVATLGVTGGTLGMMAAASAPTTGAAAGGAGAFAGAGTAVGVGTFSTAWIQSQPNPEKDNFTQTSETKVVQLNDQTNHDQTS